MSTKFFTNNTSDTLISKIDEVKVIDPDLPLRRLEDEGAVSLVMIMADFILKIWSA